MPTGSRREIATNRKGGEGSNDRIMFIGFAKSDRLGRNGGIRMGIRMKQALAEMRKGHPLTA